MKLAASDVLRSVAETVMGIPTPDWKEYLPND